MKKKEKKKILIAEQIVEHKAIWRFSANPVPQPLEAR